MGTTGRFEGGQLLTTGEKAFLVMLAAGLFGYWAGFNLSAPGATLGMPVAAAVASTPVSAEPAREAPKAADSHGRPAAAKR
jgi:hypothetical protein